MKRHSKNTGPSQRQLRVGEQLKHIIAEALQRSSFSSDILRGTIFTVTEVQASPDLRHAIAYVGCLTGDNVEEAVKALNHESWDIQKEISRQSTTKFTPKVSFRADTVLENASRIHELLNQVHIPEDED